MVTNKRFIVILKESANSRNRYFGPFVSETMALQALDKLPMIKEGGLKTWRPLETFH
jgi:hypothetical protein